MGQGKKWIHVPVMKLHTFEAHGSAGEEETLLTGFKDNPKSFEQTSHIVAQAKLILTN